MPQFSTDSEANQSVSMESNPDQDWAEHQKNILYFMIKAAQAENNQPQVEMYQRVAQMLNVQLPESLFQQPMSQMNSEMPVGEQQMKSNLSNSQDNQNSNLFPTQSNNQPQT